MEYLVDLKTALVESQFSKIPDRLAGLKNYKFMCY